jgi:hypothetical protein
MDGTIIIPRANLVVPTEASLVPIIIGIVPTPVTRLRMIESLRRECSHRFYFPIIHRNTTIAIIVTLGSDIGRW